MKQSINKYQFINAFKQGDRKDQFSYNGLVSLFEYLEELEEDCNIEFELDVVALCCDYTEYKNLREFQGDYGDKYKTFEDIEDETTVIYYDNSHQHPDLPFIIQQF